MAADISSDPSVPDMPYYDPNFASGNQNNVNQQNNAYSNTQNNTAKKGPILIASHLEESVISGVAQIDAFVDQTQPGRYGEVKFFIGGTGASEDELVTLGAYDPASKTARTLFDTTLLADGSYRLIARALDSQTGQWVSHAANVTISNRARLAGLSVEDGVVLTDSAAIVSQVKASASLKSASIYIDGQKVSTTQNPTASGGATMNLSTTVLISKELAGTKHTVRIVAEYKDGTAEDLKAVEVWYNNTGAPPSAVIVNPSWAYGPGGTVYLVTTGMPVNSVRITRSSSGVKFDQELEVQSNKGYSKLTLPYLWDGYAPASDEDLQIELKYWDAAAKTFRYAAPIAVRYSSDVDAGGNIGIDLYSSGPGAVYTGQHQSVYYSLSSAFGAYDSSLSRVKSVALFIDGIEAARTPGYFSEITFDTRRFSNGSHTVDLVALGYGDEVLATAYGTAKFQNDHWKPVVEIDNIANGALLQQNQIRVKGSLYENDRIYGDVGHLADMLDVYVTDQSTKTTRFVESVRLTGSGARKNFDFMLNPTGFSTSLYGHALTFKAKDTAGNSILLQEDFVFRYYPVVEATAVTLSENKITTLNVVNGSASVTVQVGQGTAAGAVRVELNGAKLTPVIVPLAGTEGAGLYTFSFDTAAASSSGTHVLKIGDLGYRIALDKKGDAAFAPVIVSAQVTNPATGPAALDGAVIQADQASTQVFVSVQDKGSGISRVLMYVDGKLTDRALSDINLGNTGGGAFGFNLPMAKLQMGDHEVILLVYDNLGNVTAKKYPFKIDLDPAKLISFVSHTDGQTVGGDIRIRVAPQYGETFSQVSYSLGSALLGTVQYPYELLIKTKDYANGTYAIKAAAVTGKGISVEKIINLKFANFAPQFTLLSPAAGTLTANNLDYAIQLANPAEKSDVSSTDVLVDGSVIKSYAGLSESGSVSVADIADGDHLFSVRIKDAKGRESVKQVQIKLQRGVPIAASILSPANNTDVEGAITVNVRATGDYRASAALRINDPATGNWITLKSFASIPASQQDFSIGVDTAQFRDGSRTLNWIVVHQNGTVTSAMLTIGIKNDKQPPSVTILDPAEGQKHTTDALSIGVQAADDRGVDKVQFWIDGVKAGEDSAAPYGYDYYPDKDGAHTLEVVVIDINGKTTKSTRHFESQVPPKISVSGTLPYQENQKVGKNISFTVSGTDNDAIAKFELLSDGAVVKTFAPNPMPRSSSSTLGILPTDVAEGLHEFSYRIVDKSGNVQTIRLVQLNIRHDVEPPSVTAISPLSGQEIEGDFDAEYAVSDDESINGFVAQYRLKSSSVWTAISQDKITVNGSSAKVQFKTTDMSWNDGDYEILFAAEDISGKITEKRTDIKYYKPDYDKPVVTVLLADDAVMDVKGAGKKIVFPVRVQDARPDKVEIFLEGQPTPLGYKMLSSSTSQDVMVEIDAASVPSGAQNFLIKVSDKKQNVTIAEKRLYLDREDPALTVSVPAEDAVYANAAQLFPTSGSSGAVEGQPRIPSVSLDVPSLTDDTKVTKMEVRISSADPNVRCASPLAVWTGDPIRAGKMDVPMSQNLNVWNPRGYFEVVSAWQFIDKLPDGEYTLTVSASDSFGRTAQKEVKVKIDRTPPVLTVASPSASVVVDQAKPVLTVKGGAQDLTLSGVEIFVNDKSVAVFGQTSFEKDIDMSGYLTQGASTATIKVVATDRLGRKTTQTITAKGMDKTPPGILLTSLPAEDSVISGSNTGQFLFKVTDDIAVKKYAVLVDGQVVLEAEPSGQSAEFAWGVNTTKFFNGYHELSVIVTDQTGKTAEARRYVVFKNDLKIPAVSTVPELRMDLLANKVYLQMNTWDDLDAVSATVKIGNFTKVFAAADLKNAQGLPTGSLLLGNLDSLMPGFIAGTQPVSITVKDSSQKTSTHNSVLQIPLWHAKNNDAVNNYGTAKTYDQVEILNQPAQLIKGQYGDVYELRAVTKTPQTGLYAYVNGKMVGPLEGQWSLSNPNGAYSAEMVFYYKLSIPASELDGVAGGMAEIEISTMDSSYSYYSGEWANAYKYGVVASLPLLVDGRERAPGATILAGGFYQPLTMDAVTVNVAASNGLIGSVSSTKFYIDDILVGEKSASAASPDIFSQSLNIANMSNGLHVVKAVSIGRNGLIGEDKFGIKVANDVLPPTGSWKSHQNGQAVAGIQDLEVNASDNRGVKEVRFFMQKTLADGSKDWALLGTAAGAPYKLSIDTNAYKDGEKIFKYEIEDVSHFVVSEELKLRFDNKQVPPAITVAGLAEGQVVNGTLAVDMTASDGSGISGVIVSLIDKDGRKTQLGQSAQSPYRMSWVSSQVANGNYTLLFEARDKTDVSAEKSIAIKVENDTQPPSVTITSPAADGTAVDGKVRIEFQAADSLTFVNEIVLFVDGVEQSPRLKGTDPAYFEWDSTTVSDSNHRISVKAIDKYKNEITVDRTVKVKNDKSMPTIEVLSPAADGVVDGTVDFNPLANFADDKGVTAVEWWVDGKLQHTSTAVPHHFRSGLKLAAGAHTLLLKAFDASNNLTTREVKFAADAARPAVTGVTLNSVKIANQDVIDASKPWDFTVNASDDVGIKKIEVYDQAVSAAVPVFVSNSSLTAQTMSIDTSTWPAGGSRTLRVRVYDAVGAMANDYVVNVTADKTRPAVTINSPADGATLYVGTSSLQVKATISDDMKEKYSEMWVDGLKKGGTINLVNGEQVFDINLSGTVAGWASGSEHEVVIKSFDYFGFTEKKFKFIADKSLPQVKINSPAENQYVTLYQDADGQRYFKISADVTDDLPLGDLKIKVGDKEVAFTKLQDGSYRVKAADLISTGSSGWPDIIYTSSIEIIAKDRAGNAANQKISVKIDTVPPKITSLSPPYNGLVDDLFTASLVASDNHLLESVKIYIDGVLVGEQKGSASSDTYFFKIDTADFQNADNHLLKAVITDHTGAQVEKTNQLRINHEPPVIGTLAPFEPVSVTPETRSRAFSIYVGGPPIYQVTFVVGGKELTGVRDPEKPGMFTFYADPRDYASGVYPVTVKAQKMTGRIYEKQVSFEIVNPYGRIPAVTALLADGDGRTVPDGTVLSGPFVLDVTGTASLENYDPFVVDKFEFYMDGKLISTNHNPWSTQFNFSTFDFSGGAHTAGVKVFNREGKSTVWEKQVTFDNRVPPMIRVTSHQNGQTVKGTVDLTASVGGGYDGIKEVKLLVDGQEIAAKEGGPYTFAVETGQWQNGTHTFKFRATDNASPDPHVTDKEITLNIQNVTDATLQITSPAGGTVVSDKVTIATNVNGGTAGVKKVSLYLGSTLLDEAGSAPFNLTFDSKFVANGEQAFSVVLEDRAGIKITKGLTLKVQNTTLPPLAVALLGAKDGDTKNGVFTLEAKAIGAKYNGHVDVYVKGKLVASLNNDSSNRFSLNTYDFPPGAAEVKVVAFGTDNTTVEQKINLIFQNTDLDPGYTQPLAGSTVAQMTPVKVLATRYKGVITVDYYLDDVLVDTKVSASTGDRQTEFTAGWNTKYSGDGAHKLSAKITYGKGRPGEKTQDIAPITVYVDNKPYEQGPPELYFGSHPYGTIVSGKTVLQVSVNDDAGLDRVEYFVGGIKIGSQPASGVSPFKAGFFSTNYGLEWDTSALELDGLTSKFEDGWTAIETVVYDKAGKKTSKMTKVYVNNQLKGIDLTKGTVVFSKDILNVNPGYPKMPDSHHLSVRVKESTVNGVTVQWAEVWGRDQDTYDPALLKAFKIKSYQASAEGAAQDTGIYFEVDGYPYQSYRIMPLQDHYVAEVYGKDGTKTSKVTYGDFAAGSAEPNIGKNKTDYSSEVRYYYSQSQDCPTCSISIFDYMERTPNNTIELKVPQESMRWTDIPGKGATRVTLNAHLSGGKTFFIEGRGANEDLLGGNFSAGVAVWDAVAGKWRYEFGGEAIQYTNMKYFYKEGFGDSKFVSGVTFKQFDADRYYRVTLEGPASYPGMFTGYKVEEFDSDLQIDSVSVAENKAAIGGTIPGYAPGDKLWLKVDYSNDLIDVTRFVKIDAAGKATFDVKNYFPSGEHFYEIIHQDKAGKQQSVEWKGKVVIREKQRTEAEKTAFALEVIANFGEAFGYAQKPIADAAPASISVYQLAQSFGFSNPAEPDCAYGDGACLDRQAEYYKYRNVLELLEYLKNRAAANAEGKDAPQNYSYNFVQSRPDAKFIAVLNDIMQKGHAAYPGIAGVLPAIPDYGVPSDFKSLTEAQKQALAGTLRGAKTDDDLVLAFHALIATAEKYSSDLKNGMASVDGSLFSGRRTAEMGIDAFRWEIDPYGDENKQQEAIQVRTTTQIRLQARDIVGPPGADLSNMEWGIYRYAPSSVGGPTDPLPNMGLEEMAATLVSFGKGVKNISFDTPVGNFFPLRFMLVLKNGEQTVYRDISIGILQQNAYLVLDLNAKDTLGKPVFVNGWPNTRFGIATTTNGFALSLISAPAGVTHPSGPEIYDENGKRIGTATLKAVWEIPDQLMVKFSRAGAGQNSMWYFSGLTPGKKYTYKYYTVSGSFEAKDSPGESYSGPSIPGGYIPGGGGTGSGGGTGAGSGGNSSGSNGRNGTGSAGTGSGGSGGNAAPAAPAPPPMTVPRPSIDPALSAPVTAAEPRLYFTPNSDTAVLAAPVTAPTLSVSLSKAPSALSSAAVLSSALRAMSPGAAVYTPALVSSLSLESKLDASDLRISLISDIILSQPLQDSSLAANSLAVSLMESSMTPEDLSRNLSMAMSASLLSTAITGSDWFSGYGLAEEPFGADEIQRT